MELRNIARKKQKLSQNGIEKIFQQGFESRYCSAFVYVLVLLHYHTQITKKIKCC